MGRELWDSPIAAATVCAGVDDFLGHANTARHESARSKIPACTAVRASKLLTSAESCRRTRVATAAVRLDSADEVFGRHNR